MNSGDVIFETHDGSHSILSEKFGVSYHSKFGAIQETQHVFIEHGLNLSIVGKSEISILEFGFGTGLNAFMTFLAVKDSGISVYYETIEAYPVSPEKAAALNYPALLKAEEWNTLFMEMHRCDWNTIVPLSKDFTLKKLRSPFQEVDYSNQFDLVYFDAFAPTAQPELWEKPVLAKVYSALKPGGIMATYCAKGAVKRTLKALGFAVKAYPGPPGKREMTVAMRE